MQVGVTQTNLTIDLLLNLSQHLVDKIRVLTRTIASSSEKEMLEYGMFLNI